MANTREIQGRIKSINDTMKITNAMYMIATSKLKKAKIELANTEPFFYSIYNTLAVISKSIDPSISNKYFDTRDEKTEEEKVQAYIVITGDKGLAGAYNHNIIKETERLIENDETIRLFVVGQVGRMYFSKRNIHVEHHFRYTAQNPTMNRARAIADRMIELFLEKKIDEVFVIYTRLDNSATEVVETQQILPMKKGKVDMDNLKQYGKDVVFYPNPESVFNQLIPDYLSGYIYGALMESYCCEHNARMMAMKNATDSAKDMLKKLNMAYNRARQAAITQEITEVISGVKALKNKQR